MRHCYFLVVAVLWVTAVSAASAQTFLQRESQIPLGNIDGRIDHLAVDLGRKHLFVAELGNDTVGVLDLAAGTKIASIKDVDEPQGVAFVPWTNELYIANGGGNGLTVVDAATLKIAGQINVADDCDNLRVNTNRRELVAGCGDGMLAVIDPGKHTVARTMALKAHPESFQLDTDANKVFVNLADRGEIVRADLVTGTVEAAWTVSAHDANFPMARDLDRGIVWTIFRRQSRLVGLSAGDGKTVADLPVCQDADDLFIDRKRERIYISCGQGVVDVLVMSGESVVRRDAIQTVRGARTSLFVPELDRLYVAVRAADGNPAAIWVFRPVD